MSLKEQVKKNFPSRFRHVVDEIALILKYYGFKYHCPICDSNFRQFRSFGVIKRLNAACPRCGSRERERLLWLYLNKKTDLFTSRKKLLEIAPREYMQTKFKSFENIDYQSLDLNSPVAMIKADLRNTGLKSGQYDMILCSHVLEHVEEDLIAMKEIVRLLKPTGFAIIQVPIDYQREKTYEDPSIRLENDRLKHFGQKDHVRIYGKDYKKRLETAGFKVSVSDFVKTFSSSDRERYRVDSKEKLYICQKE